MNSLYIGIGGAIILALLAALVGPHFVDWTAHRAAFEREASRVLGHPVRVLGNVDVRLLPLPSLMLTDVLVGGTGGPLAKISEFEARVELAPLLRGDVVVADLKLFRPTLFATMDREGRIDWLTTRAPTALSLADASAVSIGQLTIVGGTIDVVDRAAGRTRRIDRVDGRLEAASLLGPLKFEGDVRIGDETMPIRLATGKLLPDGALPIKLQSSAASRGLGFTFDGNITLGQPDSLAAGTLVVTRTPAVAAAGDPSGAAEKGRREPLAYRFETKLTVRPAHLAMDALQIQIGPEERGLALQGRAEVETGRNPRFAAAFSAKQLDLDRIAGLAGSPDADLVGALGHLEAALKRIPMPDMAGRVAIDAGGVVVGGGLVRDLHLEVSPRGRGWAIDALDALLPGRTRLGARGMLTTDRGLSFRGHVAVASEQPTVFAQWWRKSGGFAAESPALTLDTEIEAREGVLSLAGVDLMLGDARVRGSAEWSGDEGERRFEARLSADRLDIDRLRALARLLTGAEAEAGAALTRIELDAGSLAAWGVMADRVAIALERRGDDISVERLSIGSLGGAAVEASGTLAAVGTAPAGTLQATLKGARLDGIEGVLAGLGVDPRVADRLIAAVRAGGALDLALGLESEPAAAGGDARLTVSGQLGPTRLELTGRLVGKPETWREATLSAEATLAGPDATLLLRQAGLDLLPAAAATPGRLTLSLNGVPAQGLVLAAGFDGLGTRVSLNGQAKADDTGYRLAGTEARLDTRDINILAVALGMPAGSLDSTLPLRLVARLDATAASVDIASLTGEVDGVPVTGVARLVLSGDLPRLEGMLDAASIDAESLLELGLGAEAFRPPSPLAGPWPTRKFKGPLFENFVADLALSAQRLALGGGQVMGNPRLKLTVRPSELRLDDLTGDIAGGRVRGALRLRSEPGGAIGVAGSLHLGDVVVEALLPGVDGTPPPVAGRLDLTASFEGAGDNVAMLMASLSGEGAVELRKGVVARLDPRAVERIVKATDEGLALDEPRIRATMIRFLDAAPLLVDRATGTLAVAGGVLRIKDVATEAALAKVWGGGAIDLGRGTVDATLTLRVDAGKEAVPGADPEFALVVRGPLGAPSRSLDVAPLATYLTLRAVDREVKKIEALQVEIHERGRLDRELRHLRRLRLERETPPPSDEATPPPGTPTGPDRRPDQRAATPAPEAAPALTVPGPTTPPVAPPAPARRPAQAPPPTNAPRSPSGEATRPPLQLLPPPEPGGLQPQTAPERLVPFVVPQRTGGAALPLR